MSIRNVPIVQRLNKAAIRVLPLVTIALLFCTGQALAAPPDTMPIWRAQIFFETFNTPDAGSDDSVRVELNANNGTWVDSPQDDWEIGSPRTYDLRLDGVSRLSDLDYLRVSKPGSGGWCIGRIRLIINGFTIYDEQFPSGHWLENSGGYSTIYFIDDYFMRQRAEWINYVAPTRPNIVPVGHMRSRIQCLFGDFLTAGGHSLGFGNSNPISIVTSDTNTWHVEVDLDDCSWIWCPDLGVNFDLTVAWTGSGLFLRPDFRVENLNLSPVSSWPQTDEDFARAFMNNDFAPRVNEMMKNFSYRLGTGIQLASNGDLHFVTIVTDPGPIKTVTASASEASRTTTTVKIPDENRPVLGLRVNTGGEIEAFAEREFKATVTSGLTEETEVDVTFLLPAEILLASHAIEANDVERTRWVAPQVEMQIDGTRLVTLRDRIVPGKETGYTLRLIFRPAEGKVAQIITRVVSASADTGAKVMRLEAATSFRFNSGVIIPEGTIVRSSKRGK